LTVKFKHEKIPHAKLEEAIIELIDELPRESMERHKAKKCKTYDKESQPYEDYVVGWELICEDCSLKRLCRIHRLKGVKELYAIKDKKVDKSLEIKDYRTYSFKNTAKNPSATAHYFLDCFKKKDISKSKYKKLFEVCSQFVSKEIIGKKYAYFGIKKRRSKRPTQSGEKLKLSTKKRGETQVLLTKSIKVDDDIYDRGTLAVLKDIKEKKISIRKKEYFYTLQFEDGALALRIPRKHFTTFRIGDSNVMKDIYVARSSYEAVVNEVKVLCSPVICDESIKYFEDSGEVSEDE
jgi:hypothetical protein